ncbi:MAG: hypothetical protein KME59_15575 [Trichormus sp. ATA11-4-KO1]|nr:hypothetical protein [Trichormus sp. ATA11-4-KO1]
MHILFIKPKLKLNPLWRRNTASKFNEKHLDHHETRMQQNQVVEHLRQMEANYFLERK